MKHAFSSLFNSLKMYHPPMTMPIPMPMPHPVGIAATGPISETEPGRKRDPMLSVKLYSWRSEFHKEYALVYTSRSHPSNTCISHWRVNRDKVIFTLQDNLCVGNPVMLRIEIKAGRDRHGYYIRGFKTRNLGGKFPEQADQEPDLSVRRYKDKIGQRGGEFVYMLFEPDEAEIMFITGIVRGPALCYAISIDCHPSNGMDAVLEGPDCGFMDGNREVHGGKGLCSLRHVQRKPSSNVIEQMESYVMQQEKQLEGKDDIHKASSSSSSSTPTLTQSSAILNSGENRGPLSGNIFNARDIYFPAEAFQGPSMGSYK